VGGTEFSVPLRWNRHKGLVLAQSHFAMDFRFLVGPSRFRSFSIGERTLVSRYRNTRISLFYRTTEGFSKYLYVCGR